MLSTGRNRREVSSEFLHADAKLNKELDSLNVMYFLFTVLTYISGKKYYYYYFYFYFY